MFYVFIFLKTKDQQCNCNHKRLKVAITPLDVKKKSKNLTTRFPKQNVWFQQKQTCWAMATLSKSDNIFHRHYRHTSKPLMMKCCKHGSDVFVFTLVLFVFFAKCVVVGLQFMIFGALKSGLAKQRLDLANSS